MTLFELGRFDLAFNDFDAALGHYPRYRTAYFYRGRMWLIKDKWAEAEKDFTRAIDIDPQFIHAVSWRAIARAKTGRPQEAAEDAERAVQAEPADRMTLFYAARAYAQAVAALKERDPLIKKYGDRSVQLLAQALENGFTDTDRLAPGSDFDPVRSRADFQELLKKAPAKPKGKPAGTKGIDNSRPQRSHRITTASSSDG